MVVVDQDPVLCVLPGCAGPELTAAGVPIIWSGRVRLARVDRSGPTVLHVSVVVIRTARSGLDSWKPLDDAFTGYGFSNSKPRSVPWPDDVLPGLPPPPPCPRVPGLGFRG